MKKLFLILVAVSIFSCFGSGPKVISIEDMEKITTEMFLANAYADTKGIKITDSVDIYEPIFNKYGYTSTDMLYSIRELSGRKSVRYSDILEAAIANLEVEFKKLDAIKTAQDSADAYIGRYFRDLVYVNDSIKVDRIRDTAMLAVKIPVDSGSYEVSFTYFIDSTDLNNSVLYKYGVINGSDKYRNMSSYYMKKRVREHRNFTIANVTDEDSLLKLQLGVFYRNEVKKLNMRFDSIRVYYTPPLEFAKDSFLREKLKVYPNYVEPKKDSSTVYIYERGLVAPVDTVSKQ